jgi:polar amino acid transport system permease protein
MLQPVWDWFAWLYDEHGINLSVLYDDFDRGRFLEGIQTTIELSLVCVALSLVVGVTGAFLQQSNWTITRRLVQGYIQFFRNTPPLVQLYFFYFAVDRALADLLGLPNIMDGFGWAVVSLSFFAGAFNVEILRAGIEAVPRSTVEAAESLGYTRLQVYRHVVLPLAFRVSLPALNNNMVNLVKTTTLAYAIAVPEILYVSNQIWSEMLNVSEMMNVVWITYLVLVGALVWMMHRWERSLRIPGYGR